MNTSAYSLYIPRVLKSVTEEHVKAVFHNEGVGMPYRVDFAPCGKTYGFKSLGAINSPFKSAFVHFDSYYSRVYSVFDLEDLEIGVAQQIESEPHWRILKNRNPVHHTMMNIHQVVANCALLEKRVETLEAMVATQNDIMQEHITIIAMLEKQMKKTINLICDITDDENSEFDVKRIQCHEDIECDAEDLNSLSTHSSMPELEPIETANNTQDGMKEVGATYYVAEPQTMVRTSSRVDFSATFCNNN